MRDRVAALVASAATLALAGCQPKGIEGRWICESRSVEVVGDGYVKIPWPKHEVVELHIGKDKLHFGKGVEFTLETKKVEGTKVYAEMKPPKDYPFPGAAMAFDAPGNGKLIVSELKDVDWSNPAAAKVSSTQTCRR